MVRLTRQPLELAIRPPARPDLPKIVLGELADDAFGAGDRAHAPQSQFPHQGVRGRLACAIELAQRTRRSTSRVFSPGCSVPLSSPQGVSMSMPIDNDGGSAELLPHCQNGIHPNQTVRSHNMS